MSDVEDMISLLAGFTQSRLVFMTRDLPNTVWSLMMRYKTNETTSALCRSAVHFADQYCKVNAYWDANQPHGAPSRSTL